MPTGLNRPDLANSSFTAYQPVSGSLDWRQLPKLAEAPNYGVEIQMSGHPRKADMHTVEFLRCTTVIIASLAVSSTVFAHEKKGPLADLPSQPGPHIEKIEALGDNQWLELGVPAADPKWGKARGSSWGAKALILAPDKRGAFLFGEGVHGYVKPDGHIMDDLWFYDTATGRFERSPANNTSSISAGGFPQFHYLPSRKQFFAVGSETVAIYDPAKNQWSDARPKGPVPKGYDACGCYDSKRQRFYRNDGDASQDEGLLAYDIESNAWSHLKPKGTDPPPANTNAAFYEYDARLDIVLAIHFRGRSPGVFVYDPNTNSWADPLPFPTDGPTFPYAANTFFDRELNACFRHVAGDSSDNGVIWVYRYRR